MPGRDTTSAIFLDMNIERKELKQTNGSIKEIIGTEKKNKGERKEIKGRHIRTRKKKGIEGGGEGKEDSGSEKRE